MQLYTVWLWHIASSVTYLGYIVVVSVLDWSLVHLGSIFSSIIVD